MILCSSFFETKRAGLFFLLYRYHLLRFQFCIHLSVNLSKTQFTREKRGHYNSKVFEEKHSVKSNFKAFGLDLDEIKDNN